MSLLTSLAWRYATKKYKDEKVTAEKLDFILEAIRLAPSSFGLQPYTILVVENEEIKEKLKAASWIQTQISDSSHVIIFCAWNKITPKEIDTFFEDIAKKRNVGIETLDGYKSYVSGTVEKLPEEVQKAWATKQAYIALGFGLAAAAEVEVDSTPMEGFVPEQYDEILGLKEKGLTAAVVLTLGYRAEEDWLAHLPKVRRDKELLFEHIV